MKAVIVGDLATHARGKTLAVVTGATVGELPDAGVAFAFGKDLVQTGGFGREWLEWARKPGRTLVVVPPFEKGTTQVPTTWEAKRATPVAGNSTDLGRVLGAERQYELRGELIPQERCGSQTVTAFWRAHPNAGVVLVTTLPLWSLKSLEHRGELRAWLDDVSTLAGRPLSESAKSTEVPAGGTRTPDEWTMLLHLATGPFGNAKAAIAGLTDSSWFTLPLERAHAVLLELEQVGLSLDGGLTEAGSAALASGPYGREFRTITAMLRRKRRE